MTVEEERLNVSRLSAAMFPTSARPFSPHWIFNAQPTPTHGWTGPAPSSSARQPHLSFSFPCWLVSLPRLPSSPERALAVVHQVLLTPTSGLPPLKASNFSFRRLLAPPCEHDFQSFSFPHDFLHLFTSSSSFLLFLTPTAKSTPRLLTHETSRRSPRS